MNDAQKTFDNLFNILKKPRIFKDGQMTALCPAHNDNNPSLSVSLKKNKFYIDAVLDAVKGIIHARSN